MPNLTDWHNTPPNMYIEETDQTLNIDEILNESPDRAWYSTEWIRVLQQTFLFRSFSDRAGAYIWTLGTFLHHGSWLQFLPMFRAPASELSPHSQFQLQDSQLSLSMTTFCRPTLIYTTLLTDILTRIEMYLMCHLTDIASVWEKCNMKLSNVNTLQHPQHHYLQHQISSLCYSI